MSRCLFYSPVTDGDQVTDEQLSAVFQKDLIMNVFRNGVFGSFRHIALMSGSFLFVTYLIFFIYRTKVLLRVTLETLDDGHDGFAFTILGIFLQ